MGCKCSCIKTGDYESEVNDGVLPDSVLKDLEKHNNINYKNNQQKSIQSEGITKDQERNDKIFDFFNDLRNYPQKYIEESRKYGLSNIISSSLNRSVSDFNNLIKNNYFNLFFDTIVRKTPYSKKDILENIEKYEKIKHYNKYLYSSKANIENVNECVWNLLKDNKKIALDEILYKKCDYLIISSFIHSDNKTIITYFLFIQNNI